MKIFKLLNITLLLLFISACTSIPLKTMYHLAKTDFMTVDPAQLGAAIRAPNELQEGKEGIRMEFSLWLINKKENAQTLKIKLEKVVDSEKLLSIKPYERENYTALLYKIPEKDIDRLKIFRKQQQKRKALYGDKLKGSLSVGVSYCRTMKLTDKPILVSTWMQISNKTGLLPVMIDSDMQQEMKKDSVSLDKILPLCEKK